MTGIAVRLAATMTLWGILAACSRESATEAVTQKSPDGPGLNISFKVVPDPPRAGDNKLEVALKQSGMPVADATVTAVFYMPAMPSMNMPEMRSTFPLQSVGDGVYRGSGNLIMNGTWSVTVTASRAEAKLGTGKFTVIAK